LEFNSNADISGMMYWPMLRSNMQHDLIRLRHMLAAAQEAIDFATGKTR
jgi:hypothetical protein